MYRRMVRIREFELTAIDLFKRGQVKGAVHPYIGQEASGVGVCMALRKDDLIAGTHRSHGHNLAKGADPGKMFAEILGKDTGYCRGRGGSMHIAAFETGSLGALAVVGSGIPIAVGAALGFKMQGQPLVSVPFTGDAGVNTGNWHESLNMASIWDLPIVFVLENNQYGVSTNIRYSTNIDDLSVRAQSYGIPGVRIDGFYVLAVYAEAVKAVKRARSGNGPPFLSLNPTGSRGTMQVSQKCTVSGTRCRNIGRRIPFRGSESSLSRKRSQGRTSSRLSTRKYRKRWRMRSSLQGIVLNRILEQPWNIFMRIRMECMKWER